MREILFRGKISSGGWLYGDLRQYPSGVIAIRNDEWKHTIEVASDTVGQFTGLTDKNGTKIFEGDIVRLDIAGIVFNAVCKFHSGSFGLVWHYMGTDRWQAFTSICHVEYEVIGNLYDNPEMTEGN
jgi:uncharacterized phage protein (TIGR01671 family)